MSEAEKRELCARTGDTSVLNPMSIINEMRTHKAFMKRARHDFAVFGLPEDINFPKNLREWELWVKEGRKATVKDAEMDFGYVPE